MHLEANAGFLSFTFLDLITVITVAQSGSFRGAATVLQLGQSAVSRRVQKLEDMLGVSLFERRTTGARLTRAGRRFSTQMLGIVADIQVAVSDAYEAGVANDGYLKLGLIASISKGAVRNVLNAFSREHGGVALQLIEADRRNLLIQLSHREIDAVIASGEPDSDADGNLLLAREELFVAISSDAALARRRHLVWKDVSDETFIVSAQEPGPEIHDYILRRISDLDRSANVRRHGLCREGIMNLVGLGVGISIVADHWRGVQYPNVTFVPIGDEDETIPFSLVWRPENDNPALRRFISLARIEAQRNGVLS